ncbi:hypothetical protein RFI_15554 [Reticulomyxa filosa]|uniref:Uncharacterized protein n=1 Tax=Reticulomyxa filosa TaxID=46433 RepID=X6N8L0_RETFI|nr:hypothetical protein RFI_15554 [Reticulomyxa filosa]|eukprot:ETO21647.1 hypothetical protein RFI_15554 [Reticulomyxa filosa]
MGGWCSTDNQENAFARRRNWDELPLHPQKRVELEEEYTPTTTRPLKDEEMQQLVQLYVHALRSQSSLSHNLPLLQFQHSSSLACSFCYFIIYVLSIGRYLYQQFFFFFWKKKGHVDLHVPKKQVQFQVAQSKSAPASPIPRQPMSLEENESDIEELYNPKTDKRNNDKKAADNLLGDAYVMERESTPGGDVQLEKAESNGDVLLVSGNAGQARDTPEGFENETGRDDHSGLIPPQEDANGGVTVTSATEDNVVVSSSLNETAGAINTVVTVIDDDDTSNQKKETETVKEQQQFGQVQQELAQELQAVDQNKRLSIHEQNVQKNILRQKSMWKWSQDQIDEAEDDMRYQLIMLQTMGKISFVLRVVYVV